MIKKKVSCKCLTQHLSPSRALTNYPFCQKQEKKRQSGTATEEITKRAQNTVYWNPQPPWEVYATNLRYSWEFA